MKIYRVALLALVFVAITFQPFDIGTRTNPPVGAVSWDIIDEPFDPMAFFTGMVGPVANLVIDQRPIVWKATVAGIEMRGRGAIYITQVPPPVLGRLQSLPLFQGLDFGGQSDVDPYAAFNIQLLHPFLSGANHIHGSFDGEPGPRIIRLPNIRPYQSGAISVDAYPDEAELRLNFNSSSPLRIEDDRGNRFTVYADQGVMAVHEVEQGFYAKGRALLKSVLPYNRDHPFREAVIDFRICEVAKEHDGAIFGDVPCLVGDEFQVIQHWPEEFKENVDYEAPGIRVEFTEALEFNSLPDNFELVTMERNGGELSVPGVIEHVTGSGIIFWPDEPLLDGVIYEARVKGGPDGIRSITRDELPDDYVWRFSTLIDLNARHRATGGDPDGGPVEAYVYQTSRDAPLLAGKPTLTRLYVDWEELDSIASDWQPTSFPADIKVEDTGDGPIYGRYRAPIRIHRPDQFNENDQRFARHTVNLFNWRPLQASGSTTLEIEIEPHDVYPAQKDEHVVTVEKSIDRWPHIPKNLVFDYFTLPVGDWKDGIPSQDYTDVRRMVRGAETHLTQLFPILSARGRDMGMLVSNWGDLPAGIDIYVDTRERIGRWLGEAKFENTQGLELRQLQRMMERIHNVHGPRTNADVLVGLAPLSYVSFGLALSGIDTNWDAYDEIPDSARFFRRSVFMPVFPQAARVMVLAHEIGHTYHLHHVPWSANRADIQAALAAWSGKLHPGIEGFRMSAGGHFGWNKSSTEGNAENPTTLLSFMFPSANDASGGFIYDTDMFILEEQYERLLDTFALAVQRRGATGPRPTSALMASLDPLAVPLPAGEQPDTGLMLVAGYMNKEYPVILISAVRRHVEFARETPSGPYSASIRDESGRTLAVQPFGEYIIPGFHDEDDEWMYFQLYLPEDESTHEIEFRHGDEVIGVWTRPQIEPSVHFVTSVGEARVKDNAPFTLRWEGNDDDLLYSVYYSPDGEFPWTTLFADTRDTSIQLDAARIRPGKKPTLRVIASNGFDEAEAMMPLTIERSMEPLLLQPADGDIVAPMFDMEITFHTDLDPASIPDRFQLIDSGGEVVEATVTYDEMVRVIRLTPVDPLDVGVYTARLGAGIADRYGNVFDTERSWSLTVETEGPNNPGLEQKHPHFFNRLPEIPEQLQTKGTGWEHDDVLLELTDHLDPSGV